MNSFDSFDFNHKPIEVQNAHDNVLNTQSFSLDYAGHLEVDGTWESPHLYIGFAPDTREALTGYVDLLRRRNAVAKGSSKTYSWWRKPIFCGWHEQVATIRQSQLEQEGSFDALEGGEGIMNQCTQSNHEGWMNIYHP